MIIYVNMSQENTIFIVSFIFWWFLWRAIRGVFKQSELWRLNEYFERVNEITFGSKENTWKDIFDLMDIELMLKTMETKEHKDKVEMLLYIINNISLKKPICQEK